jgi:hypothetical protein
VNKYMSSIELCEATGILRTHLLKMLRKQGVATIKCPRQTDGGVQDVTMVPLDWANQLISRYAAAREGAMAEAGAQR